MIRNVKISKREMKEDKFTTFMLRTKDYIFEQWIYLAGGAILIIVVIIGITMIRAERIKSEKEAADIYSQAMSELLSRNYQLAIVDFKTIVDQYGSAPVSRQALFNLGNAYFTAKNYTEAITAFETYISKYKGDKFFITSAMAGIAASLAGNGDFAGAADKYREAAEKYPDFKLAGDYYLKAMTYYIRSGNVESARVIYARLGKDFEDTPYYAQGQLLARENNIGL
jgi:TolA-binding protein